MISRHLIFILISIFSISVSPSCRYIAGFTKGILPESDADLSDIPPDEAGCNSNEECDDGHDCTDDRCELTTHVCNYLLRPAGTQCRSINGECDVAENCDGTSSDCPADSFRPDTFICSPAEGGCDVAEHCTGISADCPEDTFHPAGTHCDDDNPCTHDDGCNGSGLCEGINGLQNVSEISAGQIGYHTCALLDTKEVKCWGLNRSGQLGNGTISDSPVPVGVSELSDQVLAVSSGGQHTCAVHDIGKIYCWGLNDFGQLGDGTIIAKTTPAEVTGIPPRAESISAGILHTCAILRPGGVYCWGMNENGQLGDGTEEQREEPVSVVGLFSGVSEISAGVLHTCALMSTGGVKCWGGNSSGQLGNGTNEGSTTPVDVTGISLEAVAVSVGASYTCAVLGTGDVKCWGSNENGQLGDGTTDDSTTPVVVSGLSSKATAISTGSLHSCALLDTEEIMCWGGNDYGQLGDGTTDDSMIPVDVPGLSSRAVDLSCGTFFTCAILETGISMCWGDNSNGQLGDGTTDNRNLPVEVVCE